MAATRQRAQPVAALGAVAQLGERLVRNEEVRGSIPLGSTTPFDRQHPLDRQHPRCFVFRRNLQRGSTCGPIGPNKAFLMALTDWLELSWRSDLRSGHLYHGRIKDSSTTIRGVAA